MHQVPASYYAVGGGLALHDLVPESPKRAPEAERRVELKPLSFDERSANELRPATFDQMVGQERLRRLMRRIVDNARSSGRPLGHILLAGQAGTGKTTLAQVVAHESGSRVFQVKAPVSHAVLREMARSCHDGDVMIVDEIHQQVAGDRRGTTQAADPEDFYHVMEDRRLPTETGMVKFPAVAFIACTTDTGLLPEAFLRRFPLALTLDRYTAEDMARLASANARQLGATITAGGAAMFGLASRRNPSQLNTYVLNALALGHYHIDEPVAHEVIVDLNGCTLDGLTPDMQGMLRCLLNARQERQDRETIYKASVNTVATALGHSRDTKAVNLFVEPYLIAEGHVIVTQGGRQLTPLGIERAREL
jgi:Holliday junction DNA helicase RuvB